MTIVGNIKEEYGRNRFWWNTVSQLTVIYLLIVLITLNSPYLVSQYNDECVAAHNKFRAQHSTPPVSGSAKLMRYSKGRAEYLVQQGVLEHLKDNHGYGENLFMIQGHKGTYPCEKVIQAFYDEFKQYKFDFNNPTYTDKTGHATQVVWKGTTEIGCYEKMGRQNYQRMVVCTYYPHGNVLGHFKTNVLPPKS